jgi:hypothetical protein
MQTSIEKYIMILTLTAACSRVPNTSSISVVDGYPVTKADQAPGTYAVSFEKRDPSGNYYEVGNASAVAVGPNAFLTNAHVTESAKQNDRVTIKDFQGNVVHSFDPNQGQTKVVQNQQYDGFKNDIGAFILPQNLGQEKLSQGVLPVAASGPGLGDKVKLVGAGYNGYQAYYEGDRRPENASGILRYGENTISETGGGVNWFDGIAFKKEGSQGQNVSTPGDSGGSLITSDANGLPQLSALMTGGAHGSGDQVFSKSQSGSIDQISKTDGSKNPVSISQAKQVNSASSYGTDLSSQSAFLQTISEQGANISIPTYFNPNDRKKYSSTELDSMTNQYGADQWKNSAIVQSSDRESFSGYSNGSYKWQKDGTYVWHDKSGTPTNNFSKYDTGSKTWSYGTKSGNTMSPSTQSGTGKTSSSISSSSNGPGKVNVIDTPPPEL